MRNPIWFKRRPSLQIQPANEIEVLFDEDSTSKETACHRIADLFLVSKREKLEDAAMS